MPVSGSAPFNLRKTTIRMIEAEAQAAKEGKPASIIAKMNGLTEPNVIKALYQASQAGVKIRLIVRGVCCLKPGISGVSDNIEVTSVVGRFLEHSRVYFFENAEYQVYCSSADWMERNLRRRIEVSFPIIRKKLASRIIEELGAYLDDEVQSWAMQDDGSYLVKSISSCTKEVGVQSLLLKSLARN